MWAAASWIPEPSATSLKDLAFSYIHLKSSIDLIQMCSYAEVYLRVHTIENGIECVDI